jgi:hypothetical protein
VRTRFASSTSSHPVWPHPSIVRERSLKHALGAKHILHREMSIGPPILLRDCYIWIGRYSGQKWSTRIRHTGIKGRSENDRAPAPQTHLALFANTRFAVFVIGSNALRFFELHNEVISPRARDVGFQLVQPRVASNNFAPISQPATDRELDSLSELIISVARHNAPLSNSQSMLNEPPRASPVITKMAIGVEFPRA